MCVVRLTCVDQRQHHKDEGLQGDDQDVEQCPHGTGDDMTNGQTHASCRQCPAATHEGNQHEHQLTRKHVAKQSHAMRHGLGCELDHLHDEVDWPQAVSYTHLTLPTILRV